MEDKPENTAGESARQAPAPELAERLARRGSETPTVVDVSAPRRDYARTAGWVAQKFSLVNRVRERYGVTDARPAAQPSFVMRSPAQEAQEAQEVAEVRRVSASHVSTPVPSSPNTPAPSAPATARESFAPPSAEQLAARAVLLTPQPADNPAQTPGDSTASPAGSPSSYAKASGDVQTNSAMPSTPSSGVRVRRPSVRSVMHDGPNVLARVARNSAASAVTPPGDARGVSEAAGAARDDRRTFEQPGAPGEASAAVAQPHSVAPVKAGPSSDRGAGAGPPSLLLRRAPAAALREDGEGGGAEPLQRAETQSATRGSVQDSPSVSSADSSPGSREGGPVSVSEAREASASAGRGSEGGGLTSSPASTSTVAASRGETPGASAQATRGVQSAASSVNDTTAPATGGMVMRSGAGGAHARPGAGVEGRGGRGQLPLVKATAAPSLLRAKSAAPESAVSTSTGAAVGTAPAGVTEEGSFTGSLAQQPDAPDAVVRRARVRATEITGGETRADAGIVWRRTANAAANERANATSSTAGGPSGTLMRVEDGGSDTTTTAAPNASTAAGRAEASAGGIDVGEIAEQVIRTISRRMAVERERRGFRK